jgi:hypothetical protein
VDIRDAYSTISRLYNGIFLKTIEDYEQLPLEYGSINYVLDSVVDIITHIVSHTASASLYYSVLKAFTKYTISINVVDDKDVYGDYIVGIMDRIDNFDFDNGGEDYVLRGYIVDEMPIKIVKNVLGVYSEDDEDRGDSIDNLFNNIIDILKQNTTLVVDDSSSIISNLNRYIFPYYKGLFRDIIVGIKDVIDSYARYILSESRYIDIIRILFNR